MALERQLGKPQATICLLVFVCPAQKCLCYSSKSAICAVLCLQVKSKTQQLAALHATVALLRAVLQRLKLTAKLRIALADPAAATSALDLAKACCLQKRQQSLREGGTSVTMVADNCLRTAARVT
jgi:hypothetical protein